MKLFFGSGLIAAIGTWAVWRGYGKTWGKFSSFMDGEGTMAFVMAWGFLYLLMSGRG